MMKTQTLSFLARAILLGLLFSVSGCSGSGSGANNGPMYIESCSLGCGNGVQGDPVNCSLVNISQNTEITLLFSQPVDLNSVTASSFRIVNLTNGTVPTGVFTVAQNNPRMLVFRPSLIFTGAGIPQFGFGPNEKYSITVRGDGQGGSGSYIRSVGGKRNATQMICTVQTVEPLVDPVPGAPGVTAYVTSVFDSATGDVIFQGDGSVPAEYRQLTATAADTLDVPLQSKIVLIIDDIMNVSTVANQLTGNSSTMTIRRDNPSSPATIQEGTWEVTVDYDNLLRTIAVFTPTTNTVDEATGDVDENFLSAGANVGSPQSHILTISGQLQDVVGNGLNNPGGYKFTAVVVTFAEQVLSENFTTDNGEDGAASGGVWGTGLLTHGNGGGSGRLGPLLVQDGETLTLDTDSQLFPIAANGGLFVGQLASIMGNLDPDSYDATVSATWPTVTIDAAGQAFEFSKVEIEANSMVVLTGSRPGRIFARGDLIHNGVLDLSGATPADHLSNSGSTRASNPLDGLSTKDGGPGGEGGPNGGAGGAGSTRMDVRGFGGQNGMELAGAILWPIGGDTPYFDGLPGEGVGAADETGAPDPTGGGGGLHWPNVLPMNNLSTSPGFGEVAVSDVGTSLNCRVAMVAGPGGGGAYALEGSNGIPVSPFAPTFPTTLPNTAPETSGGGSTSLDLGTPGEAPDVLNRRNLEFWRQNLTGGSGGGGGGTSLYATVNRNYLGADGCNGATAFLLNPFFDHSAAGGGGGGGSVMLVAGRSLTIGGRIDSSGGNGGSASSGTTDITSCTQSGTTGTPDCERFAAPGGGGSGGSIRLQGAEVLLLSGAEIWVQGGSGGDGAGGSFGGDGSPGLVRIEHDGFTTQTQEALVFAPRILPYDPDAGAAFNLPFFSAPILSIGLWRPPVGNGFTAYPEYRPEGYSGSQSCWMAAASAGGATGISFLEDTASNTDPDLFGWNMDIMFDPPGAVAPQLVPYRGLPPVGNSTDAYDEDFFADSVAPLLGTGVDFQTFLGTTLNHGESVPSEGSYLVVRFQGVFSAKGANNPCDLDLQGADVEPGTLTPFVSHPQFLNEFSGQRNLVRFAVVFDESLLEFDALVARNIQGVTNMRIRVQPE